MDDLFDSAVGEAEQTMVYEDEEDPDITQVFCREVIFSMIFDCL
jgi:hypothetical protein